MKKAWITFFVVLLLGASVWAYVSYTDRPAPTPGVDEVSAADAKQQSNLVDQEDLRIMQTRATLMSAIARGGPNAQRARQPHISSSANGQTLVLPSRREAYRVADLEKMGGEYFQKQNDGSYILSINLFVGPNAKLVLQNATGPLVIRMRSEPGSFATIVGFGASIRINGSPQNPVRLTSWDPNINTADTRVNDGRAYVRVIGGELRMSHAQVEYLGFWSGATGGLALTGSDRTTLDADVTTPTPPTDEKVLLPGGTLVPRMGGDDQVEITDGQGLKKVAYKLPEANLVTGEITETAIKGNAYGIFITASNQTRMANVTVAGSLVDGVLLHRFARNATIENTTVTGSRGDGFVLSRGTQNVTITGSGAVANGGNGFTISGLPLARGPSASGESLTSFGGSSVTSSWAKENKRYGVEIQGGVDLSVQTTEVTGGQTGIVVNKDATGVRVSGNRISGQWSQGIAVRDGVTGAKIVGNIVSNVPTAVYLRNAEAEVNGNTVNQATLHGVSVLGVATGTEITGNTLGGAGRSALDTARATGVKAVTTNNVDGWQDTADFWTTVKRIAKPMNLIWFGVILVIAISAIRALGNNGPRVGRRVVNPYERQAVMEERPVWSLTGASAERN
ncbi:right-handed parallel beta-helix repeat-containing protein [Herbidospora sp. RD11066]